MAKGRLPNLEYLIRNGASGTLRSIDPPYTPIVWASISTGKRPESNGISDAKPIQTRYGLKTLALWDIVEDHAKSIGLFNWYLTWPPRSANGFIVPEPALSEETFPPELSFITKMRRIGLEKKTSSGKPLFVENVRLLRTGMEYGLRAMTLLKIAIYLVKSEIISNEQILEIERCLLGQSVFTDLFCELHRRFRPYLSLFYLNAVDVAAHAGWRYYEPRGFEVKSHESSNPHQYVPSSYVDTDNCIGRILNLADSETTIIVLSDHGTRSAADGDPPFDVDADYLFQQLGIDGRVDYVRCDNRVYFSLKDPGDESVIDRIKTVCLTDTGEKLFEMIESDVHGVYWLRYRNAGKGTIDAEHQRIRVGNVDAKLSHVVKRRYRMSGIHDKHGIFIACGRGIKRGHWIGEVETTDIVPTILYHLQMPIAADMEGEVVSRVFDESFVADNDPIYIETYDTNERLGKYLVGETRKLEGLDNIKRRLRVLGYL